jgi:glyoxylase I family protein
MKLKRIHHVAYRCKDAKETVEFYQRVLNMDFTVAFAEDQVPSTKEPDPYMHVFLDCGAGNVLAFFELPTRPEMDRDHNTPEWVQHIAFEVDDYDALLAATQDQIDELKRVAPAMLEEWSRTKKAPRHAAWLHELEFTGEK